MIEPTIDFCVPGNPVPKLRSLHRSGQGRPYKPDKVVRYEQWARMYAEQHKPEKPIEGAVVIRFILSFERPKTISPKKRPYPTVVPDWDNAAKSLCDALRGVIFVDDCQAIDVLVQKRYASEPGAEGARVQIWDIAKIGAPLPEVGGSLQQSMLF